jgi:hypothetical protein
MNRFFKVWIELGFLGPLGEETQKDSISKFSVIKKFTAGKPK